MVLWRACQYYNPPTGFPIGFLLPPIHYQWWLIHCRPIDWSSAINDSRIHKSQDRYPPRCNIWPEPLTCCHRSYVRALRLANISEPDPLLSDYRDDKSGFGIPSHPCSIGLGQHLWPFSMLIIQESWACKGFWDVAGTNYFNGAGLRLYYYFTQLLSDLQLVLRWDIDFLLKGLFDLLWCKGKIEAADRLLNDKVRLKPNHKEIQLQEMICCRLQHSGVMS